ncbi:MAG: protein-glutamate O-methyltransferase CheR [Immundisolibacter sp.]|uniref:CheR family methyltransferase n=1 Tax=Immundisolibacter sp. TaxID=1934948 RepID=UPI003D0D1535
MPANATDFAYIRKFLYDKSAIQVGDDKDYLIDSRLTPVLRKHGVADFGALVQRLRANGGDPLAVAVMDAMTTNETYFLREPALFDELVKNCLPALMAARAATRRLQIWSAACSTGQEPYGLVMHMRERLPQLRDWQVRVVATDISPSCLAQAASGVYRQLEVNRGLPAPYLLKYFTRKGLDYTLNDDIRQAVEFRPLNLVGGWPIDIKPDLLLMRNVLIYFDQPTKAAILGKVRQALAADGYLVLGAAETTLNVDPTFERLTQGVYRQGGVNLNLKQGNCR